MNTLRAAWLIFLKDVRIEMRTGEIVITTTLFATLVTVLTSLSLYIDPNKARDVAPGVLWISVTFAGILAMGRSWQREREFDVMRGLLIAPIPRISIYLGKAAGTLVFIIIVELVLISLVGLLFHLDMFKVLPVLTTLLVLGSLGFIAAGNLFAAMSVRTRARDMILAIVVFPIVAPALLCGVVATRELLQNAPFSDIVQWIRILISFDVALTTVCFVLFEPLTTD